MTLEGNIAEDESDFILTDEELADLIGAETDPLQISHATQDFDVDGLVRRMRDADIKIPQYGHKDPEIVSAGFQRSVVWTRACLLIGSGAVEDRDCCQRDPTAVGHCVLVIAGGDGEELSRPVDGWVEETVVLVPCLVGEEWEVPSCVSGSARCC